MTMIRPCILLTFFLVILSSCSKEREDPKPSPLKASQCGDLSGEPVSYELFNGTREIWAWSFSKLYSNQPHIPDSLSISRTDLCAWMGGGSNCDNGGYDGLRLYLALAGPVQTMKGIRDSLCLIVVPYQLNGNQSVDVDKNMYAKIGPGPGAANPQPLHKDSALVLINNWQNHYCEYSNGQINCSADQANSVPITSFMLPKNLIDEYIDFLTPSGHGPVNSAYLTIGYYTLDPLDEIHCMQNAAGYNDSTYGYGIIALMFSQQTIHAPLYPDGPQRSDDFLRPCPRFCGQSAFGPLHYDSIFAGIH